MILLMVRNRLHQRKSVIIVKDLEVLNVNSLKLDCKYTEITL